MANPALSDDNKVEILLLIKQDLADIENNISAVYDALQAGITQAYLKVTNDRITQFERSLNKEISAGEIFEIFLLNLVVNLAFEGIGKIFLNWLKSSSDLTTEASQKLGIYKLTKETSSITTSRPYNLKVELLSSKDFGDKLNLTAVPLKDVINIKPELDEQKNKFIDFAFNSGIGAAKSATVSAISKVLEEDNKEKARKLKEKAADEARESAKKDYIEKVNQYSNADSMNILTGVLTNHKVAIHHNLNSFKTQIDNYLHRKQLLEKLDGNDLIKAQEYFSITLSETNTLTKEVVQIVSNFAVLIYALIYAIQEGGLIFNYDVRRARNDYWDFDKSGLGSAESMIQIDTFIPEFPQPSDPYINTRSPMYHAKRTPKTSIGVELAKTFLNDFPHPAYIPQFHQDLAILNMSAISYSKEHKGGFEQQDRDKIKKFADLKADIQWQYFFLDLYFRRLISSFLNSQEFEKLFVGSIGPVGEVEEKLDLKPAPNLYSQPNKAGPY